MGRSSTELASKYGAKNSHFEQASKNGAGHKYTSAEVWSEDQLDKLKSSRKRAYTVNKLQGTEQSTTMQE